MYNLNIFNILHQFFNTLFQYIVNNKTKVNKCSEFLKSLYYPVIKYCNIESTFINDEIKMKYVKI